MVIKVERRCTIHSLSNSKLYKVPIQRLGVTALQVQFIHETFPELTNLGSNVCLTIFNRFPKDQVASLLFELINAGDDEMKQKEAHRKILERQYSTHDPAQSAIQIASLLFELINAGDDEMKQKEAYRKISERQYSTHDS